MLCMFLEKVQPINCKLIIWVSSWRYCNSWLLWWCATLISAYKTDSTWCDKVWFHSSSISCNTFNSSYQLSLFPRKQSCTLSVARNNLLRLFLTKLKLSFIKIVDIWWTGFTENRFNLVIKGLYNTDIFSLYSLSFCWLLLHPIKLLWKACNKTILPHLSQKLWWRLRGIMRPQNHCICACLHHLCCGWNMEGIKGINPANQCSFLLII